MQKLEDTSTALAVILAIIGYSLCSSTMLLANKVAISHLPLPGFISCFQIVSSIVIIFALKLGGVKVDGFEWDKVKAYGIYIVAFVGSIYANMRALSYSNVETVIVFRACSPIAVTIIEYLFMDRALLTLRSGISLFVVAFGAIIYCLSDSQFNVNGIESYSWVSLYFVMITIEMTYGKLLTSSVKMDTVWGPVLYCNMLGAPPMIALSWLSGEFETSVYDKLAAMSLSGWLVLLFSCITGTLIGYMSWLCRGMTSATTFTLVGVVNKFLTVLLNVVIWDKHSSAQGLVAVCMCLLAGMFYQQAPKREPIKKEFELKERGDYAAEEGRHGDKESVQPLLKDTNK